MGVPTTTTNHQSPLYQFGVLLGNEERYQDINLLQITLHTVIVLESTIVKSINRAKIFLESFDFVIIRNPINQVSKCWIEIGFPFNTVPTDIDNYDTENHQKMKTKYSDRI